MNIVHALRGPLLHASARCDLPKPDVREQIRPLQRLFAEHGGFDVPANFAGDAAVKLGSKATLLYDEERILYGQVKSIANTLASTSPLGTDNGPGSDGMTSTWSRRGSTMKSTRR